MPRGPFIIDLFVLPDRRRHGIARALVCRTVAWVPGRLALRVAHDNVPAVARYTDLGFEAV